MKKLLPTLLAAILVLTNTQLAFAQLSPIIPVDTTAPVISGIGTSSLSSIAATIIWTTDEAAVSTFEYGTSQSYGSSSSLPGSALLAHTAVLTNLQPSTTYYYCIHATDLTGNTANSCSHSFTTEAAAQVTVPQILVSDTTAPVISGLANDSVLATAVTLVWDTDELAISTLEYGTTQSYGSHATLPATALLAHTAVLTGLAPNTTYYYCIHATDLASNATNSCNHSVTTGAAPVTPDTTAPTVSGVGASSLLQTEAAILWNTDELATGAVRYGLTTDYGSQATVGTAGLEHAVSLTGLAAGTTYHYCVDATDLAANVTHSCGHSFTTAATPSLIDANPPTISAVTVAPVTTSAATITWITSEVANGEVEYGLTASYGSATPLNTALSLTHTAEIPGLSANTQYHYRIRSSDEIGNVSITPDETFTTAAVAISDGGNGQIGGSVETPLIFSGIEASGLDATSVTITWQTSLPADSQVVYGVSSLLGQTSVQTLSATTQHSITLTGLQPNTNYYYKVQSRAAGASVTSISTLHDFNTLVNDEPIVPPANIEIVSAQTTGATSATVSATTDIPTTARVEYGISTEYGQVTATDTTSRTSHTFALTNLEPLTTYHYRVVVTDGQSNIIESQDGSFTTTAGVANTTTEAPPAAVTSLTVSGHDATSATLTWQATTPTSDAAAQYDIRYSTAPITAQNFSSALQDQSTLIDYVDLQPSGTNRTYIVAGLTPGTTYYFALKSKFENSSYSVVSNSPSVTLLAATNDTTSPVSQSISAAAHNLGHTFADPTLLHATGNQEQITIAWENPHLPSFVRTMIVRKEGFYPYAPTDGVVIYEGNGKTFTDTNLTDGKTYYYTVYSYDHGKNYSSGVRLSLAPSATSKETTLRMSPEVEQLNPTEHFVEVLKRGTKDIEVEHLQEVLARDEGLYPEKLITGYFGALTEQALKKFQRKHNLPQTGVTDAATQEKLNAASHAAKLAVPEDILLFERDLKLGAEGEDVKALQQFLIYEGSYGEALLTGYYGSYTKKAVSIFQKKYGVRPPDGYFGYKTRHKILEITGL